MQKLQLGNAEMEVSKILLSQEAPQLDQEHLAMNLRHSIKAQHLNPVG